VAVTGEVSSTQQVEPRRTLNVFDAVCVIVGIIIGAGVYEVAPQVAAAARWPWQVFVFWLAGGILSLLGACCYAELAAAYPRAGGDYVYLSRAYGRWAGFLFGWFQCTLVRPGDLAVVAFVFGHHAQLLANSVWSHRPAHLWPAFLQLNNPISWSIVAIVVLTAMHVIGIHTGKWTQNVLTAAKLLGILLLAVAAATAPSTPGKVMTNSQITTPASVAMILVLFAYGGWSDMGFIAAEIRNPRQNILRGLVAGTVLVILVYCLLNGAFLYALGHEAMARSQAVAEESLKVRWPRWGGTMINGLICLSTLGALSGMILSGARVSYALGQDYRGFGWLGAWNARVGAPRRALLTQAALTVAIILALGGFVETLMYTSTAVYAFFTATSLAVFVLRYKDSHVDRPYRVTGYPVTVVLFALTSAYLAYSALVYKPWHSLALVGYLIVGLVVFFLHRAFYRDGTSRAPTKHISHEA
jgi:APA family basic amino acid/polyamine antiporter